jgi:serine/threonine-protein kinase RsbW
MSKPLSLVIPSDADRLYEVDAFAEEVMKSLGFSQDQRDDIAISLSEAVNNAILHGNRNDPAKQVTVRFMLIEDGLIIEVQDQGNGFDSTAVPDPTNPDNLLALSGRGLLIIRHLMDEVEVIAEKTGTCIKMTKRWK